MRVIVNAVVVGAVWKRKGKEEKYTYDVVSNLIPVGNTDRY